MLVMLSFPYCRARKSMVEQTDSVEIGFSVHQGLTSNNRSGVQAAPGPILVPMGSGS